jgi:hypothetical protein
MLSRRTALVAVAVAVGFVAGCGNHAGSPQAGSPSQSPPAPADRKAEAQSDVADRLAAFRPPGDAERLPGQPPGTKVLDDPQRWPDSHTYASAPTAVTATSWWRVSGEPQDVLAGLAPSNGAKGTGARSSISGPDGPAYGAEFSWPRQSVLVARKLTVLAARVGAATILRVDALAVWVPARTAATLVPASTRSLVVSYRPWLDRSAKPHGPLTIDDPAQVTAVVALVNAAPVQPIDPGNCPYDGQLDLTFRSTTGTDVAHAQLATGACNVTYLQVDSTRTTLDGAADLAKSILATLHLPWTR